MNDRQNPGYLPSRRPVRIHNGTFEELYHQHVQAVFCFAMSVRPEDLDVATELDGVITETCAGAEDREVVCCLVERLTPSLRE